MSFDVLGVLFGFAFFYPIVMSLFWMAGGLYYYFRRERKQSGPDDLPPLKAHPMTSILVPCHNEGAHVEDTIAWLAAQNYPEYEIIAINDGSTDDTGPRLDALAEQHANMRVIHLDRNLGKANALRMGTLASRSEYLVCIDGDALLHPNATQWLVFHLTSGPRVGAVTGNPRIRNRSTLLGKMQVGEFSSIIGMIKRAQRSYGRIFTVSGVVSAFRKTALHRIGYWADDMVTEDIDVSWRLQIDHWDIRYEPNALAYILMPETFRGLWKQRLRWARGGVEVITRHAKSLNAWRKRRMWGVVLEYMLSVVWSFSMLLSIILWLLSYFFDIPPGLQTGGLIPHWHGVILGITCLLQFAISLFIDRRYEKGIGWNYFWIIWYPLAYWLLSMLTTIVAVPSVLFAKRHGVATWTSPDRGYR
ncbi:poly-beta-1,6 N-acetyl-D-glucosamine synthase [Lysobacter sp. TY2-98]|uniref:poly-beta-1,6-N-acetyl-D-glucosamine synthase n=1 Tax=Lysobacter sp. TY2-98 TaxID=2290922 RepID=UPI000E20127F|nr:poly-beta-1,6-N-acetyl-D-glucosamine synthase [Lysobacter sp. TY2-98]AXK72243.1 poly-beta-1,6 N-acetyl-D-glucosamine synthase [Lysobacter sp. TY2-98]